MWDLGLEIFDCRKQSYFDVGFGIGDFRFWKMTLLRLWILYLRFSIAESDPNESLKTQYVDFRFSIAGSNPTSMWDLGLEIFDCRKQSYFDVGFGIGDFRLQEAILL